MILLTGITEEAIVSFFAMVLFISAIFAAIVTAIYGLVTKSSDNQSVNYFKVYLYILLFLVGFISFIGLMISFGIIPSN